MQLEFSPYKPLPNTPPHSDSFDSAEGLGLNKSQNSSNRYQLLSSEPFDSNGELGSTTDNRRAVETKSKSTDQLAQSVSSLSILDTFRSIPFEHSLHRSKQLVRKAVPTENGEHSKPLASSIHRVGSFLTGPASFCLGKVTQSACDSSSSASMRVLKTAGASLGTLISLVPAIPGAILRTAAHPFRCDYSHYKVGNPQPITESDHTSHSFEATTFNVALGPDVMAGVNKFKTPVRLRGQHIGSDIAKIVKDNPNMGHVFLLQEAFHERLMQEAIIPELEKTGKSFDIAANIGPNVLGLNSGLAVISEYPILDVRYWRHDNPKGLEENFAKKGVALVAVKQVESQIDKPGKIIVFANTHLRAGSGGCKVRIGSKTVNVAQKIKNDSLKKIKEQMEAFAEELVGTYPNYKVAFVLGGDFNIKPVTTSGDHEPLWARATEGPTVTTDPLPSHVKSASSKKKSWWRKNPKHQQNLPCRVLTKSDVGVTPVLVSRGSTSLEEGEQATWVGGKGVYQRLPQLPYGVYSSELQNIYQKDMFDEITATARQFRVKNHQLPHHIRNKPEGVFEGSNYAGSHEIHIKSQPRKRDMTDLIGPVSKNVFSSLSIETASNINELHAVAINKEHVESQTDKKTSNQGTPSKYISMREITSGDHCSSSIIQQWPMDNDEPEVLTER